MSLRKSARERTVANVLNYSCCTSVRSLLKQEGATVSQQRCDTDFWDCDLCRWVSQDATRSRRSLRWAGTVKLNKGWWRGQAHRAEEDLGSFTGKTGWNVTWTLCTGCVEMVTTSDFFGSDYWSQSWEAVSVVMIRCQSADTDQQVRFKKCHWMVCFIYLFKILS